MTRQYDNYADLITFSRSSSGTALRPVSYGSELVENGTFDSNLDSWNLIGGTASQVDGEAVITYDGGNGGLAQYVSVTVGKVYRVTGEITSATSPSPRFKIGSTNLGNDYAQYTATGRIDTVVVATTSTISVFGQALTSGSIIIDNISVKEVIFDQPNTPLTLFNHPAGIPRIEYDADGNRLGLLIEESRTNLATYSEDFEQWVDVNTDLTENAIEAPDGTTTATKLIADTATGQHRRDYLSTYSAGTYTFSVFAKVGGYNYLELRLAGDGVYVDIRDGSLAGASAGITTSYEDVGNGWKRIAITHSAGANDTARINVVETSGQRSFAGDGTSGIYIYGAQLEAGAFPTSYIPTSGATATRAADVASIPVSAFGYNQSEGTVVVEFESKINSDLNYVWDLSFDSSNRMFSKASITQNLRVIVGGANQANITAVPDAGQFNKYAYAIKRDDMGLSKNGEAPTIDASGSIVENPTTLQIGAAINGTAGYLDGHIKSIKYFPRKLTAAQLQELTT